MTQLSVCILSFNRRDDLRETLGLLQGTLDGIGCTVEIIVVDNASTDGSAEAAAEFPSVRVIELAANIGMPAMNHAFAAATGDVILALDDDSNPLDGLPGALKHLTGNASLGALALRIEGGAFRLNGYTHGQPIMGYIGCGVLFKAEALRRAGGFAEWIFLYAHEWEHALRIWGAGYRIEYYDHCAIHHRAARANRSARRLRTHTTRNELLILHRYFRNRPDYPKLRGRTLTWNRLHALREGTASLGYVNEGRAMADEAAETLPPVDLATSVQECYIATHWSLQPVVTGLIRRALQRE